MPIFGFIGAAGGELQLSEVPKVAVFTSFCGARRSVMAK
jgi:hypothetical protein